MRKSIISLLILGITQSIGFSQTVKASDITISEVATQLDYNFVSITPAQEHINTAWKTPLTRVPNTIYKTSIVGKSNTGEEEGYSTVLVKNTTTNSYSEFKLQKNVTDNTQLTPLRVTCGQNNTLFIVVGNAFGTLAHGGYLYSLNVKTGETKLVASPINSFEQIVGAKINNSTLELTCFLYDDYYNNHVTCTRLVNY